MSGSLVPQIAPGDYAGAEVQLLRAHIERETSGRAVILVTSARGGDGKTLTAYSLADCLARSGRKTALVDTTTDAVHLPTAAGTKVLSDLAVYVPMPKPSAPLSREETAKFVEEMRASHEFTIIDSGALLSSEMAMAFANAVDGVLLAVCLGRPPCTEDELTVRMLERTGSHVLGVVAASPKAIANFGLRRSNGASTTSASRKAAAQTRALRRVFVGILAAIALTLGAYEYVLGQAHITNLPGANASNAIRAAANTVGHRPPNESAIARP